MLQMHTMDKHHAHSRRPGWCSIVLT